MTNTAWINSNISLEFSNQKTRINHSNKVFDDYLLKNKEKTSIQNLNICILENVPNISHSFITATLVFNECILPILIENHDINIHKNDQDDQNINSLKEYKEIKTLVINYLKNNQIEKKIKAIQYLEPFSQEKEIFYFQRFFGYFPEKSLFIIIKDEFENFQKKFLENQKKEK